MGFFTTTVNAIQGVIDDMGRNIVLRTVTAGALVDASKEWLGTVDTLTNTTVKGVFEPFKLTEMDDTIVKTGDVKLYISAAALGTVEPAVNDYVVDGTQEYRIQRVLHFKPNEDSIAFELHLRQC